MSLGGVKDIRMEVMEAWVDGGGEWLLQAWAAYDKDDGDSNLGGGGNGSSESERDKMEMMGGEVVVTSNEVMASRLVAVMVDQAKEKATHLAVEGV